MINSDLHAAFCRNVRARRIEINMTQQQLASVTGLHQPVISALEAGRYAPTLDTVSIIAKGLRIRPEALFLLETVEA